MINVRLYTKPKGSAKSGASYGTPAAGSTNISALTNAINVLNSLLVPVREDGTELTYAEAADAFALKARIGMYSERFLSAKGLTPGGSVGSAGPAYGRLDSWEEYTEDKSGYVLSAALGYDLNKRLSVLEGSGLDIDLSGYLSLDGGAMRTDSLVSKLNADLLDGLHATAFGRRLGLPRWPYGKIHYIILSPAWHEGTIEGGWFSGAVDLICGGADQWNSKAAITVQCAGQYRSNVARYQTLHCDLSIAGLYRVEYLGEHYIALKIDEITSMECYLHGEWSGITPFVIDGDAVESEEALSTVPSIDCHASSATIATALLTEQTLWGQHWPLAGNIKGDLTDVGNISFDAADRWIGAWLTERDPDNRPWYGAGIFVDPEDGGVKYHSAGFYGWSARTDNGLIAMLRDGNVGINILAPEAMLHVAGDAIVDGPLRIGGVVISYDADNDCLRISKGVLSDGFLTAKAKYTI